MRIGYSLHVYNPLFSRKEVHVRLVNIAGKEETTSNLTVAAPSCNEKFMLENNANNI